MIECSLLAVEVPLCEGSSLLRMLVLCAVSVKAYMQIFAGDGRGDKAPPPEENAVVISFLRLL